MEEKTTVDLSQIQEKIDSQNKEDTKPSIQTILLWLKTGLENFDIFVESRKKVLVKDLAILNENTIECKFYSYSEYFFNCLSP